MNVDVVKVYDMAVPATIGLPTPDDFERLLTKKAGHFDPKLIGFRRRLKTNADGYNNKVLRRYLLNKARKEKGNG